MRMTRSSAGRSATSRTSTGFAILPLVLLGLLCAPASILSAQASGADPKLQAELTKALNKKELSDLRAHLRVLSC